MSDWIGTDTDGGVVINPSKQPGVVITDADNTNRQSLFYTASTPSADSVKPGDAVFGLDKDGKLGVRKITTTTDWDKFYGIVGYANKEVYRDGDQVSVITRGIVHVTAGGTCTAGSKVASNQTTIQDGTGVNVVPKLTFLTSGVAGDVVEVIIG